MDKIDFSKQYNNSYITRFNKMKPLIMSNPIITEFGLPLRKLSDDILEECIVIAILVLNSKLKFSILQMNGKVNDKMNGKVNDKVNSNMNGNGSKSYAPDCQFWIEDSCGKVPLGFSPGFNKLSLLTTGTVLGFVGFKNEKNIFICTNIVFPKQIESPKVTVDNCHGKVLLMSNVMLNHSTFEKAKMAVDYFMEKVKDIVIFGNIYDDLDQRPDLSSFNTLFKETKLLNGKIILIPGDNDPTSSALPQLPLHLMLFDQKLENFLRNFTHPAQELICGRKVVCMNSQILKDLRKYAISTSGTPDCAFTSKSIGDLDILEELLKIRLIAPNCPDTLPSVPFSEIDPFFIDDCDYLICGGSSAFQMRQVNDVHAVCIPDFSKTSSAVLADFSTNVFTEVILN